EDARENVGAATGGERTEKRHRALGIAVSRRLRGRGVEGEAAGEREHDGSFHALSGVRNGSAPSRDGGRRALAMLPPRQHGKRAYLCGPASSVVTSRRIYPRRRDVPHSRANIGISVYGSRPLQGDLNVE